MRETTQTKNTCCNRRSRTSPLVSPVLTARTILRSRSSVTSSLQGMHTRSANGRPLPIAMINLRIVQFKTYIVRCERLTETPDVDILPTAGVHATRGRA